MTACGKFLLIFFMKKQHLLFTLFFLLGFVVLNAQSRTKPTSISVGYYAPLFTQIGIKLGMSIPTFNGNERFAIQPQLAYFYSPDIRQNFLLESDFAYTLPTANQRFYWSPAVSIGYILSRERIEGSVNLANGAISRNVQTFHSFLPTINLGFGKIPTGRPGYFFKGSFGRLIGRQQVDQGFFSLEIGLKFLIN